jgi:DNA-binding NarL/FixJ family response regulator
MSPQSIPLSPSEDRIGVGVVAPAISMRLGLRTLLESHPPISILFDSASPEDPGLPASSADVLVFAGLSISNIKMGRVLQKLDPGIAVLFLIDEPATPALASAVSLRAWGILPLDCSRDELIAAVIALHAGLWVGAPALLNDLYRSPYPGFSVEEEDSTAELTPRETEVLQQLAQGLANKQIASALNLSENTVKFHISSIYTKLGASNRAEAVRLGARRGLIIL